MVQHALPHALPHPPTCYLQPDLPCNMLLCPRICVPTPSPAVRAVSSCGQPQLAVPDTLPHTLTHALTHHPHLLYAPCPGWPQSGHTLACCGWRGAAGLRGRGLGFTGRTRGGLGGCGGPGEGASSGSGRGLPARRLVPAAILRMTCGRWVGSTVGSQHCGLAA